MRQSKFSVDEAIMKYFSFPAGLNKHTVGNPSSHWGSKDVQIANVGRTGKHPYGIRMTLEALSV